MSTDRALLGSQIWIIRVLATMTHPPPRHVWGARYSIPARDRPSLHAGTSGVAGVSSSIASWDRYSVVVISHGMIWHIPWRVDVLV